MRRSAFGSIGEVVKCASLVLVVALACCDRAVGQVAELYQAETIVTGQGEANRMIGFGACIEDVLIKVSGAQKLASDPRLLPYKMRASDYVTSFSYRDEKSGRPKGDEQATRDRSYYLIVDFDQEKIDDLLERLDLKPWHAPRPVLVAVIEMQQGKSLIITADSDQTKLQRDALLSAARRRGMRLVLPSSAASETANIKTGEPGSGRGETAAIPQGGEVLLAVHCLWNEEQLSWASEWRVDWQNREHQWSVRAETFDEVFRRGIGGAAQILSGNGDPL